MSTQVIQRLKTAHDARLYERQFLRARKPGESCDQVASRLYCDGDDENAHAYELLEQKFPGLYAASNPPGGNQPHIFDEIMDAQDMVDQVDNRAAELVFNCAADKTAEFIRKKLIGEFGQQMYRFAVKRNHTKQGSHISGDKKR